jgi:hypothetical protein
LEVVEAASLPAPFSAACFPGMVVSWFAHDKKKIGLSRSEEKPQDGWARMLAYITGTLPAVTEKQQYSRNWDQPNTTPSPC